MFLQTNNNSIAQERQHRCAISDASASSANLAAAKLLVIASVEDVTQRSFKLARSHGFGHFRIEYSVMHTYLNFGEARTAGSFKRAFPREAIEEG